MGIDNFPPKTTTSKEILDKVDVISATGTWNHPSGASVNSPKRVVAVILGGGGGGSGTMNYNGEAGGSGGSGSYAVVESIITASVSATIGAGGNAGATGAWPNYSAGGSGGSTNFLGISVNGGVGGGGPGSTTSGAGGGNTNVGSDRPYEFLRDSYKNVINNATLAPLVSGAYTIIDQTSTPANAYSMPVKQRPMNSDGRTGGNTTPNPGIFGSGGAGGTGNGPRNGSAGSGYGAGGGGGQTTFGPSNVTHNSGGNGGAGAPGGVIIFYSSQ